MSSLARELEAYAPCKTLSCLINRADRIAMRPIRCTASTFPTPWSVALSLLLALSVALEEVEVGVPVWSDEPICGYPSSVAAFDYFVGYQLNEFTFIRTIAINVGSPIGGDSMDLASGTCQAGSCPVYLSGLNLNQLLGRAQDPTHALCWYGPDVACAPVFQVSSDELVCIGQRAGAGLPSRPQVTPFGVLILEGGVGPGVLYQPLGLEVNFFDTRLPPEARIRSMWCPHAVPICMPCSALL
jgi:hypothetical protein